MNILEISRIQRAVAGVEGYTLYAINHLGGEGRPGEEATIAIAGRGGISLGMRSRAETSGRLMGTKKGIVASGRIYVGRGKSDGAPLMIIPLFEGGDLVRNLLLIHLSFKETLSVGDRKEILGERVNGIRDLIQEYNLTWDERELGKIPMAILLGEPVEVIAGQIRENIRESS
jgi:glucosamine--fructose-6-phosphate aminotransferase (isomerizing)